MIDWRWDHPRAFGDQSNRFIPLTTSLRKVKCTGKSFSWYSSNNLRSKIQSAWCRQYKLGDFVAVGPLNWDEIIDDDDDNKDCTDPGVPKGRMSRPRDGN
jgi:hypothetical protein